MTYEELLPQLKTLVRQAGEHIMQFYGQPVSDELAKDEFPVTKADLASEKILLAGLEQLNGFGVLSEEHKEDTTHLSYDKLFVIDPIDGTKDFVEQTGDFSIMLALVENKYPTLGIVYLPASDELYWAVKGQGAYVERNGEESKLTVDACGTYADMKLLASRFHLRDAEVTLKETLGIGGYERRGSGGIKMSVVAEGLAHVYVSTVSTTGEWDSAAGVVIVEEAGGTITDLHGQPLVYNKPEPFNVNGFVVTNGQRHQEVLDTLSQILSEQE